ncbi:MAG TPA: hypothetical protein VGC91_02190, partial [Pyrinomonadaceae bacterium]
MSATSQTIQLDTRGAGDDVRAAISRLAFRRRLWRACALVSFGMACVFALLCLIGVLDYARPLTRGLRIGLVAPLLSGAMALLTYAVWLLVERRRLSERAREVERA